MEGLPNFANAVIAQSISRDEETGQKAALVPLAILELLELHGPLLMTGLAQMLRVHLSQISRSVAVLLDRKLISRQPDKKVSIQPEGLRYIHAMQTLGANHFYK